MYLQSGNFRHQNAWSQDPGRCLFTPVYEIVISVKQVISSQAHYRSHTSHFPFLIFTKVCTGLQLSNAFKINWTSLISAAYESFLLIYNQCPFFWLFLIVFLCDFSYRGPICFIITLIIKPKRKHLLLFAPSTYPIPSGKSTPQYCKGNFLKKLPGKLIQDMRGGAWHQGWRISA